MVIIDSKREKRNEDWLDKMADMMIVRKYISHATEGRILPNNFGYVDINCFGNQISKALRLDVKKDLPATVIFRPLMGGKPSEGIYKRDKIRFNAYSASQYLNKHIQDEKKLLLDDKVNDFHDVKTAALSLGYREVVIDLWDNSCVKKNEYGEAEKLEGSLNKDHDDL
jgi:hypothetical protein